MKLSRTKNIIAVGGLVVWLLYSSCGKEKGEKFVPTDCDTTNVKYSDTIKNIINAKCASSGCHVSGGSGNGDFSSYVGVNSKVGNGSFDNRVFTTQDMPPAGSPKLSECEKKKIKRWLNMGAPNN